MDRAAANLSCFTQTEGQTCCTAQGEKDRPQDSSVALGGVDGDIRCAAFLVRRLLKGERGNRADYAKADVFISGVSLISP
jgi:hypothetical protein